jgi:hypothetical protein
MLAFPFAMPKKWCNDRYENDDHQQQKQRRLFEPCDGRDPNSEYDPDQADTPCPNMDAGRKGPQREHRQCCKRTAIGVHHSTDIGHEHEMHC